jgi:hypothetical protein
MIWLNKAGTFGIASAAYWWCRLGGTIVRASHQLLGTYLGVWHTLFSDDRFIAKSFPEAPSSILLILLYFMVLRVPFELAQNPRRD